MNLKSILNYFYIIFFGLLFSLSFFSIEIGNFNLFTLKIVFIAFLILSIYLLLLLPKFNSRLIQGINKATLTLFLVLIFTIRVLVQYHLEIKNVSDFLVHYNAAVDFSQGNYKVYFNSSYYQMYPGYALYSLFNSLFFILTKVNSIYLVINTFASVYTSYYIYKIIYFVINSTKFAFLGMLLYNLYPSVNLFCGQMNNQTLSIFFITAAMYYFLQKRYFLTYFLLGCSLLFKSTGLIFFPFYIIYNITSKDNFRIKLKVLIYGLIGFLIPKSILYLLSGFNLINTKLSMSSYCYFLAGLSIETNGMYNESLGKNQTIFRKNGLEYEFFLNHILKLFKNPNELIFLFESKFKTIFTSKDSGFFWTAKESIHWENFNNIIYITLLFFIVLLSIKLLPKFKEKTINVVKINFVINLTFYLIVIFTLFVESQNRYRYEMLPYIIICGVLGYASIESYISKFKYKIKTYLLLFLIILFVNIPYSNTIYQIDMYHNINKDTIIVNKNLLEDIKIDKILTFRFDKYLKSQIMFQQNSNLKSLDSYNMAVIYKKNDSVINKIDISCTIFNTFDNNYFIEYSIDSNLSNYNAVSFALYKKSGFDGWVGNTVDVKR